MTLPMINTNGMCYSFKLELLKGIHTFQLDVVKVALYVAGAVSPATPAYTPTGEVTDPNWVAGGQILPTSPGYPQLDITGTLAVWAFTATNFVGPFTMTFRSLLLYNSTKQNRALMVLDKGIDITLVAGPLNFFTNPGAPYPIMLA